MKKQTSSKGFAVLSTASVICKVLSLVYLPVQTALVHDSGNGVIGAGFKLYLFIYSLTNAGLPVVISKFVSEQVAIGDFRSARKTFKSAFLLMLAFGVISTAFTFFGAGLLDKWCDLNNQSTLMFMVIAPTFLFTSVSCSLRGYFQGRHNMTPTAISQIIEQIVNSSLTVAFEVVLYHYAVKRHLSSSAYTAAGSAAATAAAALASALFLSIMFFAFFRKQRRSEYRHQTYEGPEIETATIYKQIFKFSLPAIISCVATSAIDIIDTTSCQRLLTKGGFTALQAQALFGIYSQKYQRMMTLATMFVAPLVTAMIPALSAALAKGNRKYVRYKIRESYKLIYLVIMPVVAGLTFLAKPIISVIFMRDNSGSLLLVLGTWAALLVAAQSIQSGILLSMNRPIISPLNTIVGMLAKLACNYIFIPIHAFNIYGALLGNILAWVIAIALNQYFINRTLQRRMHTARYMIVPGIASIVMGAVCLGFYACVNLLLLAAFHKLLISNDIAVFLTIPLGALIYFTMMIKLGGILPADIRKLPMGNRLYTLLRKIPFLRPDLSQNPA